MSNEFIFQIWRRYHKKWDSWNHFCDNISRSPQNFPPYKMFCNTINSYYILRKQMATSRWCNPVPHRMRGNGRRPGTPYALRAERNWRKTKYADTGRQNLVLNVWNEQRPWLSYISPHVFTPKEDQEGWTNGRFPHTKLKLCHKGVLLQNFNRFPDF